MAEERDMFTDESDDQGAEVEAHKHYEDKSKREKFVESPADEDDEVEAHKF
jgi:hypothetical protein